MVPCGVMNSDLSHKVWLMATPTKKAKCLGWAKHAIEEMKKGDYIKLASFDQLEELKPHWHKEMNVLLNKRFKDYMNSPHLRIIKNKWGNPFNLDKKWGIEVNMVPYYELWRKYKTVNDAVDGLIALRRNYPKNDYRLVEIDYSNIDPEKEGLEYNKPKRIPHREVPYIRAKKLKRILKYEIQE